MPFSAEQNNALAAPLDKARIAHRSESGRSLSYLEGWDVMEAANTVFGYDGWGYEVIRLQQVAGIWLAVVLTTVNAGGDSIRREDVGVGIPAKPREAAEASPAAHETAIKGAVTDALKRALRGYGDQFGLSLYDKDGDDVKPQAPAKAAAPAQQQHPPATKPTLTPERADKLGSLIRIQLTRQGVDDIYARDWIADRLKRAGLGALTDLTEAAGASLLQLAQQWDVTQPVDGGRR